MNRHSGRPVLVSLLIFVSLVTANVPPAGSLSAAISILDQTRKIIARDASVRHARRLPAQAPAAPTVCDTNSETTIYLPLISVGGTPTASPPFTPVAGVGGTPTASPPFTPVVGPCRAAVLRGRVATRAGMPLSGVTISVLGHPEYGSTQSGGDGMFDLPVDGGGMLTLNYARDGLLPAQRQVEAPWQDYAWLPEVVLIPLDSQVTTVDLRASTPVQVARGSVASDTDGMRQATLLFSQGTAAELVLPDGLTRTLSMLNVRATEYTVGESGPQAMPADLPPSSGYTYAVELSVDEALAAGATDVRFDRPVYSYVENFLGFSVGGIVPAGYYDRGRGAWVASQNGRVVGILGESAGMSNLDTDGDAAADSRETLAALGITDAERARLAELYDAGQSLWRVPITHFTPWDYNWPSGLPTDATAPRQPPPRNDRPLDDTCKMGGSIIECQNQTLGEAVGVAGTSFGLYYQSDRQVGRTIARTVEIPLSGANVPASLQRIELEIMVAGQRFSHRFAAAPDQSHTFTWDGLDAYGRRASGARPVVIRIGYVYEPVYNAPSLGSNSFGVSGIGSWEDITVNARGERIVWQEHERMLGNWDARAQGLGGWTLDVQHAYDPHGRVLYYGRDARRDGRSVRQVIRTIAGVGAGGSREDNIPALEANLFFVEGIAVGPDGSLYLGDNGGPSARLRRVSPDGMITTVAGTFSYGPRCDNCPATQSRIDGITDIALGPDGSLYLVEGHTFVRRIGPDGLITTVAGSGEQYVGDGGDGGPALEAEFASAYGLAVGPDGSMYISDTGVHRVRRVGPDGIITAFVGAGIPSWEDCSRRNPACYGGDGGPATQANLNHPLGLAAGPDGSVYIADVWNSRVRRVGPEGTITTVAGTGMVGSEGDGGPATSATISFPNRVSVAADGSLYITDSSWENVRRVATDGIITTVAGSRIGAGSRSFSGDFGPALQAQLAAPRGAVLAPDGSLYINDVGNYRIRRVGLPLPGFSGGQIVVPSEDGSELYTFDAAGRHLRTTDAIRGALIYGFEYDGVGRLATVSDASGNITRVERNASGAPVAIIAPGGQRTTLSLDANGYLARIADPSGAGVRLTYDGGGLLSTLTDPNGNDYRFTYDGLGRLTRDADPAGGSSTLARADTTRGYTATLTTAMNRVSTFVVESLPAGDVRRVNVTPGGTQTEALTHPDGSREVRYPDGTRAFLRAGPDPRFGMQAPLLRTLVITTPAGLVSTVQGTRAARLADPDNFLTLQALTDTLTINGRVYTTTLDATTNRLTERTPEGRQNVTIFDAQGRVVQYRRTGLAPLALTYNANGRLATLTEGSGADARTYTSLYDAQNRLIGLTDPLSRTVSYSYDAAGRLARTAHPGGSTVAFAYDANGNLSAISPPERAASTFDYTAVNLPEQYTPPHEGAAGPSTTVTYDADRQPVLMTRQDGTPIRLAYDAGGRPDTLTSPSGVVRYNYDPGTGSLVTLSAPGGGTLSYTYDGALLTGSTWAGSVAGTVSRSYDADARLSVERVNDSAPITLVYDRDGLVIAASALGLRRDAQNGLIAGTTLGSVVDTRAQNVYGETTGYHATVNTTELLALQYTRDRLGRITQLAETTDGQTATFAYTYGLDGRLTEVHKDGTLLARYRYDANGNRLSATGASGTVTGSYDAQDRLTQYGDTTFMYTTNGELLRKTIGTQVTNYSYDALGNVQSVALPDGRQITYLIDGNNRRIGKKIDGAQVHGFLYRDPLQIVAELDGANNVVSRFVYASRSNVPDYMIKGERTYRIISDHLGSPRLVVDVTTGVIAQRLAYDPYGQVIQDTNPGFQPFGFAGGLYDRDTRLTHFGARDYDAGTGRWTAQDPILFAGGDTNLYGYVLADPINLIDPSGNIPLPLVLGLIGGGVGALANLAGQLLASGGQFDCVDWSNVAVAGAVGFGQGFLAPFAVGRLGAAALGATANAVEYAGAQAANGQAISPDAMGQTILTGAAAGAIGGPINAANGMQFVERSPLISTGSQQVNRAVNNNMRIAANVGLREVGSDFLGNTGGTFVDGCRCNQ